MDSPIQREFGLGKGLTQREQDTLRALLDSQDLYLEAIARGLHIHVNTLKYRIKCIKQKWCMPMATNYQMVRYALLHGYIAIGVDILDAFQAHACATLPSGNMTPISQGLRLWLSDKISAFKAERGIGRE